MKIKVIANESVKPGQAYLISQPFNPTEPGRLTFIRRVGLCLLCNPADEKKITEVVLEALNGDKG